MFCRPTAQLLVGVEKLFLSCLWGTGERKVHTHAADSVSHLSHTVDKELLAKATTQNSGEQPIVRVQMVFRLYFSLVLSLFNVDNIQTSRKGLWNSASPTKRPHGTAREPESTNPLAQINNAVICLRWRTHQRCTNCVFLENTCHERKKQASHGHCETCRLYKSLVKVVWTELAREDRASVVHPFSSRDALEMSGFLWREKANHWLTYFLSLTP